MRLSSRAEALSAAKRLNGSTVGDNVIRVDAVVKEEGAHDGKKVREKFFQ